MLCLECKQPIDTRNARFCSRSCVAVYNNRKRGRQIKNLHPCFHCHKPTKNKKFCSRSCAISHNNRGVRRHGKAPESCHNCGGPLDNPRKKYCDNSCQQEHAYKQYIKRWRKGLETGRQNSHQVSHHVRRFLTEKCNGACCKCGWAEVHPVTGKVPLQVNHIDGDHNNTTEDNLELICPNCHSLTENWGALNKGKGYPRKWKRAV